MSKCCTIDDIHSVAEGLEALCELLAAANGPEFENNLKIVALLRPHAECVREFADAWEREEEEHREELRRQKQAERKTGGEQ